MVPNESLKVPTSVGRDLAGGFRLVSFNPEPLCLHNDETDMPVGGRLQFFWTRWQKLGASPYTVKMLREGYRLPFLAGHPPLSRIPLILSSYANLTKQELLDNTVKELLDKKAIEVVWNPTSPGFYSRLFLVPKKSGGWRPVIDLSVLNNFLEIPSFKMETPESIRKSLQQGEWVTSLDFSDAYLHIPVHPADRKFLRFKVGLTVYQFTSTPFGLATIPRQFTKLVKEVKIMAGREGLLIHQYLDDWINRTLSYIDGRSQVQTLLKLVDHLGLIVNSKKSELEPTQDFVFVGYHYDLIRGLVLPPPDRLDSIAILVDNLLKSSNVSARSLMSLIGTLVSAEKLVPLGRLHLRPLQWELRLNWNYKQPLDKSFPVSQNLKSHLQWWEIQENLVKGAPLHPPSVQKQIFTDASNKGWGAHMVHLTTKGVWSVQQQTLHINYLEMWAVLLALKAFEREVKGQVVLIVSDNTTVVSHINRQGGTRSWDMCAILWRTLTWCATRGIQLRARHIAGRLNVIADKLSRHNQIIGSEWSLHKEVFQAICQCWNQPLVDLFATKLNHKLPVYVSPLPDPQAWEVDALNIPWEGLVAYAYPPTVLITQVIQKLRKERCSIILIAPAWPTQTWFWELVQMTREIPLQLPLIASLLQQPFSQTFHQQPGILRLHAWKLDSRSCRTKDSVRQWQQGLLNHRDRLQDEYMQPNGIFSHSGVQTRDWMQGVLLSLR